MPSGFATLPTFLTSPEDSPLLSSPLADRVIAFLHSMPRFVPDSELRLWLDLVCLRVSSMLILSFFTNHCCRYSADGYHPS